MATSNGKQFQAKRQKREREGNDQDDEPAGCNSRNENAKVFNDSIHGHIEVNKACLAIIDTPQFQRLRFIKQLGFCYYVYPGASHNRFEHSIGVYHLAGEMVRSIHNRQGLGITKKDILCVQIAGLCHDLGHGPHSHMFDGKFIPLITEDMDWKHEDASLSMFDYLIKDNKLMESGGTLREHGLDENDIVFIKELIYGPLEKKEVEGWPYRGRGEEKAFLYEIVSNKRTGIDVDKWDYLARDCHHLGNVNNFNHNRFITFARVLNVDGQLQICSRDKEIGNLYQMFYTRYILHRSAYQHKVACAIEIMAVDALVKANEFLKIPCPDGTTVKLSESITNMPAYMNVTDNILWDIYSSQDEQLSDAKKIMKRLFNRDLYRFLDERSVSAKLQAELGKHKTSLTMMKKLRDQMIELSKAMTPPEEDQNFQLQGLHFRLQFVYMDFGKKNKDPLMAMRYYTKKDMDTPIKCSKAGLLIPPRFSDNLIRVYSIDNRPGVCDFIKNCFGEFCSDWDIDRQLDSMTWEDEMTSTPEKNPYPLEPKFSAGSKASMSQDY